MDEIRLQLEKCREYGVRHVIFDVILWTKYVDRCNMEETVQNLLTHELCHVLIGMHVPNIDEDTESKDYLTNLDAVTFHEAFAHLVSYHAQEIDTVNWHTEELKAIREQSVHRMKQALAETVLETQQKNLYDALCGRYYDKFACMAGMLYLAEVWEKGENQALKECFEDGYHGFALKTIE